MQFLKKNYEKVLLGLVLFGLVLTVAFVFVLVASEKQAQEERRIKIFRKTVKELPPPDLSHPEAVLKRVSTPVMLDFASTNKLFNPVRWQKTPQGQLYKNPVGSELDRLEITRIEPLHLIIVLDQINASESGVRYEIEVEQQAAALATHRMRVPIYTSVNEKKAYGDKKHTFTLQAATGVPENPTLILQLDDVAEPISISRDKPYRRVDDYTVDLRYPPNTTYANRRRGDSIVVANEQYTIVDVSEDKIVLSAKSNNKKTTIRYNARP